MTLAISRRRFGAGVAALALLGSSRVAIAQSRSAYKDASLPVDARVDDLLKRMTIDEKVAQMVAIWQTKDKIQNARGMFDARTASRNFPHGLGQISRPGDRVGSKAASGGTVAAGAKAGITNRGAKEAAEYINAAQRWAVERTRLGIPMFIHEESLHGFVNRDATMFPQSIALASTFDPPLVERVFSAAAKEARARGCNIVLAPVVDVARDPRWGRIEETYGEDPHVCAEIGLAAIRGFQGQTLPLAPDKVFVTLKHMTGHGQPENGTNIGPAQVSERVLRENFFPPFERAIKELPVRAVMPSYNEIDGVPSHASKWLLTDILRGEWGFQGATMSDYFAVRELITRHKMVDTPEEAALLAIKAGVDAELPDGEAYYKLPALVRAGKVSEADIDLAVRRLLKMKFEGGFFENPYVVDANAADALTGAAPAVALAREAAQRSMVLLKNDKGVLPLDPAKVGRLLVVGTHARDTPIGGYSEVPRKVVSVLEGMQAAAAGRFQVSYSEGVRITRERIWEQDDVNFVPAEENRRLIADAVAAARNADTILLVLGDNEQTSREAWADNHLGDRQSLDLIGEQNELAEQIFALGKPTVVLLLNGRPLSVNLLAARADALVEGWYLGQETGHAVADVLMGRVNPGGKLPVSIARDVGQLPVYYNYKPSARRGYLQGETKPLYPFGYGLSYTSFELGAPRLSRATIGLNETVRVDVEVRNTGQRMGDEVVQLYLRDVEASVTRPVKELKKFSRVTIAAGGRQTVSFELTPDDLSMWNIEMKRVVEPGKFEVMVGPNSVDLKTVELTVA